MELAETIAEWNLDSFCTIYDNAGNRKTGTFVAASLSMQCWICLDAVLLIASHVHMVNIDLLTS